MEHKDDGREERCEGRLEESKRAEILNIRNLLCIVSHRWPLRWTGYLFLLQCYFALHNMYVKNELLYYSSVLTPSSAQPPPTSSSTENDHETAPECLLEIRSTGRRYTATRSILHTVQPALSTPPFLPRFEWRGNYSWALAVHWQSVGSFRLPVCLQIASVCTVCGTPGLYCCWSVSWPRTKLMTHKEQQWSRETMKGVDCSCFLYFSCHIFWSSILFIHFCSCWTWPTCAQCHSHWVTYSFRGLWWFKLLSTGSPNSNPPQMDQLQ